MGLPVFFPNYPFCRVADDDRRRTRIDALSTTPRAHYVPRFYPSRRSLKSAGIAASGSSNAAT